MPKALTEETKQQIVNLWLNHNYSQQACADWLGVGYGTVHRAIKEYTESGAHEPPKGMPIPERAVPIEQVTKPVVMTEEHTVAIPDAVLAAVDTYADMLTAQICTLRAEIADKQATLDSLRAWRKEAKP